MTAMTPGQRAAVLTDLFGTTVTIAHGNEQDFLLLDDPDGRLDLTAAHAAALADRHGGLGADGVVRVVRTDRAADPDAAAVLRDHPEAEWFLDLRHADGRPGGASGHGLGVLAAHLRDRGRVTDGGSVVVATRAGARRVRAGGRHQTVDMGSFALPGGRAALAAGTDVAVVVPGLDGTRGGLRVSSGELHTVVALPGGDELAAARPDLGVVQAPEPPEGTHLGLVVPGPEEIVGGVRCGTLDLRVLVRGREARSSGSGCCAAAVAVRAWAGPGAPDRWLVRTAGGESVVDVGADEVTLTAPAVLLGEVTLTGPAVSAR